MANPRIDHNGDQRWYNDGQRHREDGPAVIHSDGTQQWWSHDLLHRSNGPAVIYNNGSKEWYLNGIQYNFNYYCNKLKLSNEDILLLRIQYG